MKQSLVSAIENQAGVTFLLPLFQAYNSSPSNYQAGTGQGANYYYDIVQFVGVTILPVPNGQNGVWVQPAAMLNTSFVFAPGSITPAGTSAQFTGTFTTPKLTQ